MKFMKTAFGEFHKFHMKECKILFIILSYDPLKWDFITFKTNIISARKHIIDMDIVNDVTITSQSVITRVVIWFLWHDIIHWITATSYDKQIHCNAVIRRVTGAIKSNRVISDTVL